MLGERPDPTRGDNEVIESAHVDQAQGLLQRQCEAFVGDAGVEAARRVVVRQHDAGGIVSQGSLDDFARIHAGVRQRAAEQFFAFEQAVLYIEMQYHEGFMRLSAQQQVIDRVETCIVLEEFKVGTELPLGFAAAEE